MTLMEMLDKRNLNVASAKKLNDTSQSEGRNFSKSEKLQYDGLMAEVHDLNEAIKRAQELQAIETTLGTSQGTRAAHLEGAGGNFPGGGRGGDLLLKRAENPEYTRAFEKFVRTGEDRELRELRTTAMVSGVGSDGGYFVPTEMDKTIDATALSQSAMRQLCEVRPISTPEYHRIVSVHGATSGWAGEEEARAATDTPELKLEKPYWGELYAYPQVTQQMLDFTAYDVVGFLAGEVGEKFGQDQGTAFISGNGIKKPRGILDFPYTSEADAVRAFGTLRYVPSGIAGGITLDIMQDTVFSLKRGYRQGSAWLMNSTTAAYLSKLKDGEGQYVWQASIQQGQPPTLFGYPVELDDFLPDIAADVIPILFGNFMKGFMIVDLPAVLTLRDPFTNKPFVGFYFMRRMGTLLKNSEAIRGVKASLT